MLFKCKNEANFLRDQTKRDTNDNGKIMADNMEITRKFINKVTFMQNYTRCIAPYNTINKCRFLRTHKNAKRPTKQEHFYELV